MTRIAITLVLLATACTVDMDPDTPEKSMGERCDEMQVCGRLHCADEIDAIGTCISEGCPDGVREMLFVLRGICMEENGCNTTTCDLVDLEEGGMGGDECDDQDRTIYFSALMAMVVDDWVAICQGLGGESLDGGGSGGL